MLNVRSGKISVMKEATITTHNSAWIVELLQFKAVAALNYIQ